MVVRPYLSRSAIELDVFHRPDGNIYRSIDGGTTWSPLWDWVSYPTLKRYYTYDVSLAPWIGLVSPTVTDVTSTTGGTTQIGWMMEALGKTLFYQPRQRSNQSLPSDRSLCKQRSRQISASLSPLRLGFQPLALWNWSHYLRWPRLA